MIEGRRPPNPEREFSQDAVAILERSVTIARASHQSFLSTEHLLLAVSEDPKVKMVLERFEINQELLLGSIPFNIKMPSKTRSATQSSFFSRILERIKPDHQLKTSPALFLTIERAKRKKTNEPIEPLDLFIAITEHQTSCACSILNELIPSGEERLAGKIKRTIKEIQEEEKKRQFKEAPIEDIFVEAERILREGKRS